MKKVAMHVHTLPYSACASVSGEETVKIYKNAGFDGIFVTNHYMKWALSEYYGMTPPQAAERYLEGYNIAKNAGEKLGLEVYLGMELCLEDYIEGGAIYPYSEVLLYGMTKELLLENQEIYYLSPKKLFEFCKKNNIVGVQAHPFRRTAKLIDPEFIMGIEAFNGNISHFSNNEAAERYADEHNLIKIYSDDFHVPCDAGKAATLFPDSCKVLDDYLNALMNGQTKGLLLK